MSQNLPTDYTRMHAGSPPPDTDLWGGARLGGALIYSMMLAPPLLAQGEPLAGCVLLWTAAAPDAVERRRHGSLDQGPYLHSLTGATMGVLLAVGCQTNALHLVSRRALVDLPVLGAVLAALLLLIPRRLSTLVACLVAVLLPWTMVGATSSYLAVPVLALVLYSWSLWPLVVFLCGLWGPVAQGLFPSYGNALLSLATLAALFPPLLVLGQICLDSVWLGLRDRTMKGHPDEGGLGSSADRRYWLTVGAAGLVAGLWGVLAWMILLGNYAAAEGYVLKPEAFRAAYWGEALRQVWRLGGPACLVGVPLTAVLFSQNLLIWPPLPGHRQRSWLVLLALGALLPVSFLLPTHPLWAPVATVAACLAGWVAISERSGFPLFMLVLPPLVVALLGGLLEATFHTWDPLPVVAAIPLTLATWLLKLARDRLATVKDP